MRSGKATRVSSNVPPDGHGSAVVVADATVVVVGPAVVVVAAVVDGADVEGAADEVGAAVVVAVAVVVVPGAVVVGRVDGVLLAQAATSSNAATIEVRLTAP